MRFMYYGDKPTKRELEPYFLHFTRKANLSSIAQYKALLSQKPDDCVLGCSIGTSGVYAYNLQVIQETQDWSTLPSDILANPDDFVCLLFTSTPDIWWVYPEESRTAFNPCTNRGYDCPLNDYEILTVTEAFDLAETNIYSIKGKKGLP